MPGQGHVGIDGRSIRFDDHVCFHFALVSEADVTSQFTPRLAAALNDIGVRPVVFGPAGQGEAKRVLDLNSFYQRLFQTTGSDVLLFRPDFVLYGHASRAKAAELVEQLLRDLGYIEAAAQPIAA